MVVEEGEAILARHTGLVLVVKLGGAVRADIGKLVSLPPHDPDHLRGLTINQDDRTQMAVANKEVTLGSLW